MVDITPKISQTTPPDRRLLAQLTKDPKLIRYLENLGLDAASTSPDNYEALLELIINTAELAIAAQGSANAGKQGVEELGLAIQALEIPGVALQSLATVLGELAGVVQAPDQEIQRLQRNLDELENQLVEIRPPIPQVIPTPTPPFAPSVVTVTAAYAVLPAPAYQPLTVRADATTSGFTVTLPSTPTLMQLINVKKIDATANVVTISGGAINIDGGLTVAVGSQYTNLQVQYNGATWDVL